MGQITATMGRIIKELLREKSSLFWTIGWPIIWVMIGSVSFVSSTPPDIQPYAKGSVTVPMMIFAIMIAGMSNLPASVAYDRERGMLGKLMSMPINPMKDFLGRILGLASFSCLAVVLVALTGFALGARFRATPIDAFVAVGFLAVVFVCSAGIGTIIASLIKPVQGSIMTGVGISVITAAVGGMFTPIAYLPSFLQSFAKIYPVSIANSSILYVLAGIDFSGYNPLTQVQVSVCLVMTALVMVLGITLYSRVLWRRR